MQVMKEYRSQQDLDQKGVCWVSMRGREALSEQCRCGNQKMEPLMNNASADVMQEINAPNK